MTDRFYRLLIGTGLVFGVSLVLALLDGAGWFALPQPLRPALLVALVLSTLLGIVLLSGAIGMPKKPGTPEASGESDAPPEADREDAPRP
jgi:hypothetical protein